MKMNKWWRPPKYTDPEVLEKKIDEYFDSCFRKVPKIEERVKVDKNWNYTRDESWKILMEEVVVYETETVIPPTISRMWEYIWLSRTQMRKHEKRHQKFLKESEDWYWLWRAITRWKGRVEGYLERELMKWNANVYGVIWTLKYNFWRNK